MSRAQVWRSSGVEQHIHDNRRHENEQLRSRVLQRDLFHVQRAADYTADYRFLLKLAQRLRPGQNIFRPGRFATESTFDEVVKTNGVCPDNAVLKLGAGKRFQFNYDYCEGC